MVREETRRFVEEYRELLEVLAKHGSPSVKPIAAAFLIAVDAENAENAEGAGKAESKKVLA